MTKPVEVIEVCQTKNSSESNYMERWNELIAGFVLGNLTPEEAESVAQILAENPQLATHVARLRNTATVRSLGKTEWSMARSQDGSEGWADTAFDRPLYGRDDYGRGDRSPNSARLLIGEGTVGRLVTGEQRLERQAEETQIQAFSDSALLEPAATPTHTRLVKSSVKKRAFRLPRPTFERFSLIEALLVPVFNPLWWIVIVAAMSTSIDSFLIRRSHESTLEELAELKAMPQIAPIDQPVDHP